MAAVQQMSPFAIAKNLFNAFEEFTVPRSESTSALNEAPLRATSKRNTTFGAVFFEAYEKFNLPQVASTDSLASMASSATLSSLGSTHTSCSNFDEIIPSDANMTTKLYLALEKLTVNMQGSCRLPPSAEAHTPLTTDELTLVQRFFAALEEFLQVEDSNDIPGEGFPKFC